MAKKNTQTEETPTTDEKPTLSAAELKTLEKRVIAIQAEVVEHERAIEAKKDELSELLTPLHGRMLVVAGEPYSIVTNQYTKKPMLKLAISKKLREVLGK